MMIGPKMKARRKTLGLNQRELAEGICAQALISKIERESSSPSSKILQKLSDRLGVPVTYFLSDSDDGDIEAAKNKENYKRLETLLRAELMKGEYQTISMMMAINADLIAACRDDYFINLFKWLQGVLYYRIDRNPDKVLGLLKEIESQVADEYIELHIDILMSIGMIYDELSDDERASDAYQEATFLLNQSISFKKRVHVLRNHALSLKNMDEMKEALKYVLRAIEVLIKHKSLHMMGDLYLLKGNLFERLGDTEEATQAYEDAIWVFKTLNIKESLTVATVALHNILPNNKLNN